MYWLCLELLLDLIVCGPARVAGRSKNINMTRGGGTRDPSKRGASQPTLKRAKATTSEMQPQIARLRNIEQQLQCLLGRSEASQTDSGLGTKIATGGVEGRITIIEKMMVELKARAEEPEKATQITKTQESAKALEEKGSDDPTAGVEVNRPEERKRQRKNGSTTLNMAEVPDKLYSRFYLINFSEESRRCANPYALIEKII